MADCDAAALLQRADRIAGIRARMADGWRHMRWEAGLREKERELRKGGGR
jgi:hypothetical protein